VAFQEHGQFCSRSDAELSVRVTQVIFHSLLGHEEGLGNLAVRPAIPDERCDLPLVNGVVRYDPDRPEVSAWFGQGDQA
jgi:hypothetical protein